MAKVTLGKRPKQIPKTITVQLPDGEVGTIGMVYRYRTRAEFGKLIDDMAAAAGVPPPGEDTPEAFTFSMSRVMAQGTEKNTDYILAIADGWDLDAPFDADHVRQLCDQLPSAAIGVMEGYREAVVEGRLGN